MLTKWKYHEVQQEYIRTLYLPYGQGRPDFVVALAGRGTGKTDGAQRWIAGEPFVKNPFTDRPIYLYAMPTADQCREIGMKKVMATLDAVAPRRWKRVGDNLIFPENHAEIRFRGMFSANRAEGEQYAGIVMDEMSDMPPAVFLSLRPTMSHCHPLCVCVGIPKRYGTGAGMFRELCERAQNDTTGRYRFFHWTSDGILDPSVIAAARHDLAPRDFREQYMASWETAGGMVYYAFCRDVNVVGNMEADPSLPLLVGCDFNVSPMSWVVCQADIDENGTLEGTVRVLDEIRINQSNTQEALDELSVRWGGWKAGYKFFGDTAGNHSDTRSDLSDYVIIERDRRFRDEYTGITDITLPTANPRVLSRVASVNSLLHNAAGEVRLQVSRKCKYLIKDFERVSYKHGTRQLEKGDLELTHMSDALGYLVHSIAPIGYDTMEDESPFGLAL